ncbi:MAG: phosphatase PAP2 family protein [Ktedonobacterales bacterium]
MARSAGVERKSSAMRMETPEIKPTVRYEVARWISAIVHPIAFPLLTLGLAAYFTTSGSLLKSIQYVVLALLLTSLPISIVVAIQVLRRKWTDLDVSVRRQRYALYPIGIACMLALTGTLNYLGAPQVVVRSALAFGLANIADGLINFVYKVSAHATGAAACAVILWATVPATLWELSFAATLAALLVGWSRVVLKRHTTGQVLLGWTVGALSVLFSLRVPLPGLS